MDRQDNALPVLVKIAQDALAAGDLDTALAAFANAVEHHPDQPESHNNLGAFYMGTGQFAAAESCFRRAAEILPENANLWFNLGLTHMRLDQPDRALVDFATVLAETPDDPEAHNNLAVAQFLTGDAAGAEASLICAVTLRPNFPNAVLNLCDIDVARADTATAIARCEEYLAHFQDSGVVRRLVALLESHTTAAEDDIRSRLGRLLEARQAMA